MDSLWHLWLRSALPGRTFMGEALPGRLLLADGWLENRLSGGWLGSGWVFALATLLGAAGIGWMLPRGKLRGRWLGALLCVIAFGLLASRVYGLGDWLAQSVFAVLAVVTVAAAVGTITFRNPVYCAVWFALSLLGTAGLMFFQGSQFLGVATVVVYAGAILVTLLFVLMLANPRGRAIYDRLSWEPPLSAAAGMVMVGILSMTITGAVAGVSPRDTFRRRVLAELAAAKNVAGLEPAAVRAVRLSESGGALTLTLEIAGPPPAPDKQPLLQRRLRRVAELQHGFNLAIRSDRDVRSEHHLGWLGVQLFGPYFLVVQVAGLLLLVALIGAAAVVMHSRAAPADASPAGES
jgi:NADH-quinone oxidoreductase subunit J